MNETAFVPLAEAGPEDSTSEYTGFLDTPAAKVNVVKDPIVRDKLGQVWSTIREIKSRRSELEEEWLAIQRMSALEHDDGQKYKGRSNAYLPVYARARKTLTSQLMKGLFPSDDFMDVVDRENGVTEQAKAVKTVVQYEMETSARIRAIFKPFIGQFVDFGFSVMKRWYRTQEIIVPKRVKRIAGVIPKLGEKKYDEGFTLSNRSVFNVVVYPEWAEDKRDLMIEAERMEVPVSFVERMNDSKRWENVKEALNTGTSDNFDWCNQTSLHDVSKIAGTTQYRNTMDSKPVNSVTIVEAWFRMSFPAGQYAADETPGSEVPARAVFVNGVPVLCRRNNFYNQESPFEYGRDNIIAGNFYGNGAGRLVRFLQYLANDFANQTNDVGIYGLNPITLVNTSYFSGAMDSLKPGRTYRVRDVDQAMKFVSPKVELVQYGQTLLQQIVVMAQDGSGAPPVLQGSKAASTATGTQLLSQNAISPLQDTVEDIESQVMIPLMKAAWELSKQFRSEPFIRKILGEPTLDPATGQIKTPEETVSILPADIDIDCEFRYLASSQANSRQMRQQGLLAFAQLMQPMLPLLQQQGKTIDPTIILQKAWTDGLGNRGFDKMIVPMMQPGIAPGMAPGQPGQPMPPEGMPTPGQPPPPPVEQGNVMPPGSAEPLPGEDYGDMRVMVDEANGRIT